MANTIEAAEAIEAEVAKLEELLEAQLKIAETLGDGAIDATIQGTRDLIKKNKATAKHIRETADG